MDLPLSHDAIGGRTDIPPGHIDGMAHFVPEHLLRQSLVVYRVSYKSDLAFRGMTGRSSAIRPTDASSELRCCLAAVCDNLIIDLNGAR